MSVSDVKQATPQPLAKIAAYELSTMFEALANAVLAIEHFSNRHNYGPAIQQLIWDLGQLGSHFVPEDDFNLPKLAAVLSKISNGLDHEEFDTDEDMELMHGYVYLWDHVVTKDERREHYKKWFSWDHELNPVEET